jgi:hypothetical protein
MSYEDIIRIKKGVPEGIKIKKANITFEIEAEVDGRVISSNGLIKRKYKKHQKQPVLKEDLPPAKWGKRKKRIKIKPSPQRLRGEYSTRTADIMAIRKMLNKFKTLQCLTPLMLEELKKFERMDTALMPREAREAMLRIFYQSRESYINKGGDVALAAYYKSIQASPMAGRL